MHQLDISPPLQPTPSASPGLFARLLQQRFVRRAVRAFGTTSLAVLCAGALAGLSLPASAETVFTTQTPSSEPFTDAPIELGMKFQSAVAGKVTAIRYWKDATEPAGGHTGRLWDASGNSLATVTFSGETASGWQQQELTTPVTIQANTTYVVSVNAVSAYAASGAGLASAVVNGNLSSVADGANGVYGSAGTFPTQNFNSTNYFRDVSFSPTLVAGRCILGEKFVSVTGPGGPFVRNSVTSNNANTNADNPLVASVPGASNTPAATVNIPAAALAGDKVFYKFVVTNCGSIDLYNVRLDDCVDQRSVGDSGFLVGGAAGRCVENPRLIPASSPGPRIVAPKLMPGQSVTVTSASFPQDPISSVDICKQFGGNRVNGIVRNDSQVEAEADVDGNGVGETFTFMDDLNLVRCQPPGVKIVKFTNGHDGDNANGVPTSTEGGFTIGTNTVAQVAPNAPITWTYRVTNNGNEPLINVTVTDDRLGMAMCPKTTLAVGETMNCTRTGFADTLTSGGMNVLGCGSGGNATRPTYANRGTVTANGANSNAMVSDQNDSHYCNPPPPVCNLSLDKTCEVVQAPTSDWASCKGKLQQFSMIWPANGGTINISGIANNAPGGVVNPGQRVTFTGPFSSNDNFLTITGAVSGQSVFHVSCSDKDMDGLTASNDVQPQLPGKAQDCGKFEGNGKANSASYINSWLLDGLTDAEGKVLNCSPAPAPTTNACAFQLQDPPACGSGQSFKPTTLTFKYTGGGCATQNNTQDAGKTSCSGQIDPNLPVNVVFPGGTVSGVQPGGTFTIPRSGSNTVITLSNAGGTENDGIHTSCSQPLAVGDVFFSLTLVAEDGIGLGRDVKYSYKVTNTGTAPASNISLFDDKLGAIGSIGSLPGGQSTTLTATASISQTTTNIATATSVSCPDPGATSTATVTVMPPPPCSIAQEFYKVEDDKYKLKLTNTGNKVATLDQIVLNWPANATYGSIKEVKLGGTIYKADKSNLVVKSGVPIKVSDWTESDVSKRQIDPGKEETLEISFQSKWKKENCPNGTCFSGTGSFAQGCTVDLSPSTPN
jgi:hypothetical protein